MLVNEQVPGAVIAPEIQMYYSINALTGRSNRFASACMCFNVS